MAKGIEELFNKHGHLKEVKNHGGTKRPVWLSLGMKGWGAAYSPTGRTFDATTGSPEAFARRLARSGHKSVRIMD